MPIRRVGFYALSLFRSEVLSERSKPQWDQIVISRSRGLNTLCLVLLSTSAVAVLLVLGFTLNTMNVMAATVSQNVHLAEIRDLLLKQRQQ